MFKSGDDLSHVTTPVNTDSSTSDNEEENDKSLIKRLVNRQHSNSSTSDSEQEERPKEQSIEKEEELIEPQVIPRSKIMQFSIDNYESRDRKEMSYKKKLYRSESVASSTDVSQVDNNPSVFSKQDQALGRQESLILEMDVPKPQAVSQPVHHKPSISNPAVRMIKEEKESSTSSDSDIEQPVSNKIQEKPVPSHAIGEISMDPIDINAATAVFEVRTAKRLPSIDKSTDDLVLRRQSSTGSTKKTERSNSMGNLDKTVAANLVVLRHIELEGRGNFVANFLYRKPLLWPYQVL